MAEPSNQTPPPAAAAETRRLSAPATGRNQGAILDVLKRVLPETGLMLEIGAGTGEHAAHFAPRFPGLAWRPTDPDPGMRASIDAWTAETEAPNLLGALDLDAAAETWPIARAAAVFSANMIHIAPWECCLGLLKGAGRVLIPTGVLVLYGPFKLGGRHTADSNARFDESLRGQDPAWGVRDLDDVAGAALAQGLRITETARMPADNLTVIFRKEA